MFEKKNKMIFFKKNNTISAIRFNNEVFFKNKDDSCEESFMKRVISSLIEKGMFFEENLKIKKLPEEKLVIRTDDSVNITKKQIGKILSVSDINSLEKDELLYTKQIYEVKHNEYSFQSSNQFENAQSIITSEMLENLEYPVQEGLLEYFSEEDVNKILNCLSMRINNGVIMYNTSDISTGLKKIRH